MVQIPSPQPFRNSSSNRTGCFCVLPQSIVGFEPHRRRVPPQGRREPLCAATEAVKCKGAPQNLFCGEDKSHPRNHSKAARPIGRAVFAFSGAEAGLGSTYTGETKGGARSASLSQADERLPAQFPCPRPKRRGFTGGTWFRPSDRARPALRCRNGVSAETPAIRREPLCAATEAVKCKGAPGAVCAGERNHVPPVTPPLFGRKTKDGGRATKARREKRAFSAATPAIRCGACYLPGRRGWQALLPTPQPPHWPHRQPQPPALRRFFMERRASAAHRARSPRITAVPMALRADRPAGTRRRHRARPRRTAAGRRLPPSSRNPAPAAPPQWPRCRAYRAA